MKALVRKYNCDSISLLFPRERDWISFFHSEKHYSHEFGRYFHLLRLNIVLNLNLKFVEIY